MKKTVLIVFYIVLIALSIYLHVGSVHVPPGIDKVLHFLGFVIITSVSALLFKVIFSQKFFNVFLIVFVFAGMAYATFLEVLQKHITSRSCDFSDWIFATGSLVLTATVIYIYHYYVQKKINEE